MSITDFKPQCARILSKLERAKQIDAGRKAFGSSHHNYGMGAPISPEDLAAFETQYDTALPEAFAAFLLYVGNGQDTPHIDEMNIIYGSSAGPYYGLFPLGSTLSIGENIALTREVVVSPNMSLEAWKEATAAIHDPAITDENYESELERLFGGILPIGHQGCLDWQGLLLSGAHKGRIVYMNEELYGPHYLTRYETMLDWYEDWLDGVIAGPDAQKSFDGAVYISSAQ
ncbi:MAG: SMI1/KNR4 family protein [Maricaulaceae bacterium]